MSQQDLFIVSHSNCPACNQVKRIVGDQLPILDVMKSDKACDLVREGKVRGVPAAVEKIGSEYRTCKLKISGNTVRIDCGEKHIEISKK